ncbi:hypothetical protein CPC08DRAFT_769342 [Agrocybe pediades]|nr:hypothetical protein CPC08DRAFT_769342 [Agrocybe pediades]
MDLTHIASLNSNGVTTYSRRLHGTERLLAAAAEHVDGCSHIFIGCGVFFKAEISPTDLMQAAKEAWIRTRFAAPWVAQRTSSASSELAEPNSWMNTYETSSVPEKGFERAVSWAESTLFWRDEVRSLEEWEEVLKNAYWRPSDGRFGMEWHFARGVSENEYFIMASVAHWLADGRGILPLVDVFLQTLRLEIRGGQTPTRDLPWGSEVSNLPPATVVAIEHKKENVDLTMPQPPTHKEFLRPLIETPQWERLPDRQADIKLSRQETLALHAICKGKKVTITALINSLCILADVQTAFHAAPDNASLERVLEYFKAAEVYVVRHNMADRRSMLPESIMLSRGPVGFGNLVMQIQPTAHNMDHVRNVIQVEEYDKVSSNLGSATFWGGLVAESDLAMKANKSCTPEKFIASEHLLDAIIPIFHKDLFFTPGLGSTSVGKLSSLNLFNDFRPSIASSDRLSPFVISSLALGLRITGPDTMHVMVMMWEYDGQLVVHLLASPRWHGEKAWKFYVNMIRNSLESILRGLTKL